MNDAVTAYSLLLPPYHGYIVPDGTVNVKKYDGKAAAFTILQMCADNRGSIGYIYAHSLIHYCFVPIALLNKI